MDIKKFKMYLRGESSPEELKKFRDWVGSGESRDQLSDLMKQIDEKEFLENEQLIESNLWKKINERLEIEEIISSISEEHKRQQEKLDKSRAPVIRQNYRKRNMRTTVIFAVVLLVSVGSALVLNNIYTHKSGESLALVEKATEKGQKLTLHLSDGTKVTLNSKSEITFPKSFEGNTREVNVKGEVFFDVAHDKNKPFIVHAGELDARVLGTSFNFQYFPEKNYKRISLVTGKVQVTIGDQGDRVQNKFILVPGEEIRVEEAGGEVVKDLFDVESVTSWKNGTLYFKYATLDEVVQSLENWYGVDIQVIGQPNHQWKLTARFSNENLGNVLQSLSHSQGIKYSISGKSVIIKF